MEVRKSHPCRMCESGMGFRDGTSSRTLLDVDRLLALLPVAGAELVGLQRIQHTQNLRRVAADREIGDVNKADDALRVHEEGGALRHTGLEIEDAELLADFALDVCQ